FAYIHNVWQKSHQDATCNVDAECSNDTTGYQGSKGGRCDTFVHRSTLPLRDRQEKTIGDWVNKKATRQLQVQAGPDGQPPARGKAEDLTFSWNQLMTVAIATAGEGECRKTGDGDRDSCHAQFFDSTSDPKTKQMVSYGGWLTDRPKDSATALTICHNPVRSY